MTKGTAKKAAAKPAQTPTTRARDDRMTPMDPSATEVRNGAPQVNNRRACYAIKTLIREVEALFPEITYEVSNYDGRNTGLDVSIHAHESPGLPDLLSLIRSDKRIRDVIHDEAEQMVLVQVRSEPRTQDLRDPFGLADAWDILSPQTEEGLSFGSSEGDSE